MTVHIKRNGFFFFKNGQCLTLNSGYYANYLQQVRLARVSLENVTASTSVSKYLSGKIEEIFQ